MLKRLHFSLLFFASFFVQAQQAYYNDVNLNLTGLALRDELATKVINTHVKVLDYTPGVWEADRIVDLDPADPTQSKVLLIYGYNDTDTDITNDRTRDKNNNGSNAGQWNREHVFPQSLGGFDTSPGPGTDVHHVRASDVQWNGTRANRPYEAGNGNSGVTPNGNWYPGDEWKGDIARMVMYMYLRYGNQTLPSVVTVGATNALDPNMIDLLLQWNAEDPVSQVEDNRNNYLENASNTYGQGNRNPFIDNPFLATRIWGGPAAEDRWGIFTGGTPDTTAPTVPTGLVSSNITSSSFTLSWTASTDDDGVLGYEIFQNNSSIGTSGYTTFNVIGLLPDTSYNFDVAAFDLAGNVSTRSNSIQVTTLTSGGGSGTASELFISEYVEGSSDNKAIEVANFTGASIDLSTYTLQKQVNGAGSWMNSYTFPAGTVLADGDVFVIANSSNVITGTAGPIDDTTGAPIDFNGNDPVGLFKNGVLIDIVGVFNGGSSNFSINETLRRKPTVSNPNTTFDKIGEWDVLASDTFDGLGTHTLSTLSLNDPLSSINFSLFPNPVSDGRLFFNSREAINRIVFYNITGQEVLNLNHPVQNKPILLQGMKRGIYLAKIELANDQTLTRKIVVK